MMKTQYYTASSLDGFIATEDDSLDWLFPLGDIQDTSYPEFIAEVGALAMGSATYLWMPATQNHVQLAPARGYLRSSAWGSSTPAWPEATSAFQVRRPRVRCSRRSACSRVGFQTLPAAHRGV